MPALNAFGDEAIDEPAAPRAPFSEEFVAQVKKWESFKPQAYGDYKQTSVGYGTRALAPNEVLTEAQADERLRRELGLHARNVDLASERLGYTLTPRQREALISFDFNTGSARVAMENSGGDLDDLLRRMGLYVNAGGKPLDGLRNRRRSEADWWRGDAGSGNETMREVQPGVFTRRAPLNEFGDEEESVNAFGDAIEPPLFVRDRQRGGIVPAPVNEFGDIEEPDDTPILNAIERGKLQSALAAELQKPKPSADTVTSIQRNLASYPPSEEFKRTMSAGGAAGFFDEFRKAPVQIAGELLAESLTSQIATGLEVIPQRVAAGAGIGAVAGAAAGAIGGPLAGITATGGALTGAGAGFAEGSGVASLALEQAGGTIEALAEAGVDPTDYSQMRAAFGDPQRMARARELATAKAVPVAAFDTLSALIGGRLFAAPARSVLGKIAQGGVEIGVQSGLGMTGEAAGQFGSGQDFNAPAILAEGVAEGPGGLVEIGAGLLTRQRSGGADARTVNEFGDEDAGDEISLGAEGQAPAADPLAAPPETPAPPPAPETKTVNLEPLTDAEREHLAREYGFARGNVDFADRADFEAIVNAKPGQPQIAQLQLAETRARQRREAAEATTSPPATTAAPSLQPGAAPGEVSPASQTQSESASPATVTAPEEEGDPFSAQPGVSPSVAAPEATAAKDVMMQALRAAGHTETPRIVVVGSTSELLALVADQRASAMASEGTIEAAMLADGGKRRMIVNLEGAAAIATQRGLTLDQRLAQLALHEVVHHYQSLGALFPPAARKQYHAIVDAIVQRMPEAERRSIASFYGFDLSSPGGRASLAEEALARFNETNTAPPTWAQRALAEIRDWLRQWFPSIAWSDNDVRALLDSARRKATEGLPATESRPALSAQVKIARTYDAVRKAMKGMGPMMERPDWRELLGEFGEASSETGRKLRYVFELSDGSRVSAEGAIRITQPEVAQRLQQQGLSERSTKGRQAIYKALPDEIKAQLVAEVPIEELPPLGRRPSVREWLQQQGSLLGDAPAGDLHVQALENAASAYQFDMGTLRMSDGRVVTKGNVQPAPTVALSAQPEPEGERRRFIDSAKAAQGVEPSVQQRIESIYQPITNAQTVEGARERINALGIDRALAEVMATGPSNPPTALLNAMGIELIGRLQTVGRLDDAAALIEHIAEQATSQGQAIQALSLIAKLTPEGINVYAQRLINRVARERGAADPEVAKLLAEIARLKDELRTARKNHATQAILDIADAIRAGGLSPEKQTELLQKLRDALINSRTEPGRALDVLTQILVSAGIDRAKAVSMAKKAIASFREAQKTALGKLLRAMLTRAKKEGAKARVPRSTFERLVKLNEAGLLDDETMLGAIGKKLGVPVFTKEHAAKLRELLAAHERAPVGDLKLAAAARVMSAAHELVPVDFWTKVRAVRNLLMLLNPKTIIRNVAGNAVLWLAEVPADTLAWSLDKMTSLVTGARTRTGLQLAERLGGLAGPVRDYTTGRDYAKEQGQAHRLWLAGVEHLLTMARLTSRGVFHEGGMNHGYRSVFSSRVMRGLEALLALALGVGDRAFHQSAYLASLERQREAIGAPDDLAPTPAMVETALLDANAAIFQDENVVSKALAAMQRTLNLNAWGKDERKFGLGNVIIPFTQVPGSIAARAAGTWSPIGFVRGLYAGRHLLFNHAQFDQRAFTDLLARGALGSGLGFLGAYLFKLGILSALPEDDPDREAMRRAAGLGQYRINASELKRRMLSGDWHTPSTQLDAAQAGDVVINYDWSQPLAVPLAAGAQVAAAEAGRARALAHGGTVAELATPLLATAAGLQTLEAQPLVSSFSRFIREAGRDSTAGNPVGGLAGAVLTAATKELASGFVPTFARQITALGDNTMREDRASALGGILADLPGVSSQYPPRYDVLGEMQERYQAGTNSAINVLLNPAFITRVQSDPLLRELDGLYERTGESGVLLRQSSRTVQVNGRTLELTDAQRSDVQRVAAQVSASLLRDFIAAPMYARLPDDARAKLAASAIAGAAAAAKILRLGDRPRQTPDQWTSAAILRARQLGITPE